MSSSFQLLRDFCGLVSCLRNNMYLVAMKMGRRQGGASRTGGRSGAYLNRYVTEEQRGRRPIFIATRRAGAGSKQTLPGQFKSWFFKRRMKQSALNSFFQTKPSPADLAGDIF